MTVQVKHEAEHSRQHARYRIPAVLQIEQTIIPLKEWSVSGFSTDNVPPEIGNQKNLFSKLTYEFGNFTLSTQIEFEIIRFEEDNGSVAARFINLSRENISLMHYIINAFLAGEVVEAGDILSVVSRDAFVEKDLDSKLEQPQSATEKVFQLLKKTTGYAFLLALLFSLTAFVSFSAYQRVFVIQAMAARVDAPIVVLRAPDNGFFEITDNDKGSDVNSGNLLGIVKLVGGGATSIESPCDCRLFDINQHNNIFVGRGEPLFTLVPQDAEIRIVAEIAFEDVNRIQLGNRVSARLINGIKVSGVVVDIRASSRAEDLQATPLKSNQTKVAEFARVSIRPDSQLPVELFDTVVSVEISTFPYTRS